jgi:hypothetical protein
MREDRMPLSRIAFALAVSASVFSCASSPPAPEYVPTGRGMIIPLYIYPDGTAPARAGWDAVAAVAQSFPDLEVIAVINPASGPGVERDSAYRRAVRRLNRSGAVLVGYVPLGYGARSLRDVDQDLERWQRFYPDVGGFFLDEVPSRAIVREHGAGILTPQVDLTAVAIRTRGMTGHAGPVVANPGVPVAESYFGRGGFDIVVTHEELVWPEPSTLEHASPRSATLVYGDGVWDEDRFIQVSRSRGYVFVNDHLLDITGRGTYPWSFLPGNLHRQAELLTREAR